jgi:hypothetical protein
MYADPLIIQLNISRLETLLELRNSNEEGLAINRLLSEASSQLALAMAERRRKQAVRLAFR